MNPTPSEGFKGNTLRPTHKRTKIEAPSEELAPTVEPTAAPQQPYLTNNPTPTDLFTENPTPSAGLEAKGFTIKPTNGQPTEAPGFYRGRLVK